MNYEEHGFIISADLGQVNDFTAITIIERISKPPEHARYGGEYYPREMTKEYHLRHIERPERGTPYTEIVERLYEIYTGPELEERNRAVVVDLTGIGRAVWDYMRKEAFPRGTAYGITITGGSQTTSPGSYQYNVPKRDLVAALQIAFQNKDLKIARGIPSADILVKELTNFKVKINTNGTDQYEAWREGIHDDIVLSAAMGVWLAGRTHIRWS